MGAVVCSSHVASAASSLEGRTPHTLHLLQFAVSPMGDSLPWTSPMRVLPKGCGSLQTIPALVCSLWCSPSGKGCSRASASWGHKSTNKPAPAWVLLSMEPEVLPGACFSLGFPRGHRPLWVSTALWRLSTRCRWISSNNSFQGPWIPTDRLWCESSSTTKELWYQNSNITNRKCQSFGPVTSNYLLQLSELGTSRFLQAAM